MLPKYVIDQVINLWMEDGFDSYRVIQIKEREGIPFYRLIQLEISNTHYLYFPESHLEQLMLRPEERTWDMDGVESTGKQVLASGEATLSTGDRNKAKGNNLS